MHDIFSEKFAAVCGDGGAPMKLWCFTATHSLERLRVLRCSLNSISEFMELKPAKSKPASAQQRRPQGLSAKQALAMLENDQGGSGDPDNDDVDVLSVDEWVKALSEQLLYDSGDDDDMNARELADADRKATGEDIIQSHEDSVIINSVQSKRKRHTRSKASTDIGETSESDEQLPAGIDVDIDDVPPHMLDTGLQSLSPAEMAHEAMLNVAEFGEEPELAEAYAALKQTALKPHLEVEHLDAAVQCWASAVEASASAVRLRFAGGGPDSIGKNAELSLVPRLDV